VKQDDQDADAVRKAFDILSNLQQLPGGTAVYDQLAELVNEQGTLRSRLDQVHAQLLRLLNTCISDPEKVIALDAASAASPTVATLTRGVPDPADAGVGVPADRRINTSYRLHLDRKRDEIEKLQEVLAQGIREAVAQNREFGALLQMELNALRQAQEEKDVRVLHQILVDGIGELINSQRLLESKLNQTGDYLNLIKDDSERLRDELHKVRLLSFTDEFTGLPNRRAFMRDLQEEIGRAQRYGLPLALALIDLDEFKSVNDAYGHNGGDEVLRCYASEVLGILRRHDLVARYGGEEFAVMLPNTTEAGICAAIDKARQRAREVLCRFGGQSISLPTFSAGVAMYRSGESATDLIERADRALYAAKRLGRNRTELAADLSSSILTPGADSAEPRETV
jgi:diguanylate cyclase (GGDEF)-like protein